jgi:pimeloyl-ACP methyl ester carboxylesterase
MPSSIYVRAIPQQRELGVGMYVIEHSTGATADSELWPRPPWLSETVWPFPTSAIRVDGGRVAVASVGRGPVLLFVHTGLSSIIWRDVMSMLASDFRCVALDAPGTGMSERLPLSKIGLESSAHAVAAIIRQLDLEDIVLVIHDLGGLTALAGAAELAERVCGLVAVNTFAWRPDQLRFRAMLRVMGSPLVRELDVATGLLPRVTATAVGAGRTLDNNGRRALCSVIRGDRLRAFHQLMSDALHSEPLYARVDRALTVEFRDLPVLTIFGERNDPFEFQKCWKALFPSARQVVVPNGHHFPMCDDPTLVATSIRAWYRDVVAA